MFPPRAKHSLTNLQIPVMRNSLEFLVAQGTPKTFRILLLPLVAP